MGILFYYIHSIESSPQQYVYRTKKNIKNNWLINLRFLDKKRENALLKRESLLRKAHSEKILLRPVWKLLHTLEMYKDSPRSKLKVAEDQEARLISLPSSPQLTTMKNQN